MKRIMLQLRAELRIDGQTLRGCGYYGGARDN